MSYEFCGGSSTDGSDISFTIVDNETVIELHPTLKELKDMRDCLDCLIEGIEDG